MGNMTLGAVLGRNQSFEQGSSAPDGWSGLSPEAAFAPATSATHVHSSPTGLAVSVGSTGGDASVLHFAYGTAEYLHATWFSGRVVHPLHTSVWARAADAPSSGRTHWYLDADSLAPGAPIAHGPVLQRYEAACTVTSQDGLPRAGLTRVAAAQPAAAVVLDDVLTQVDLLPLHPDWSLTEGARILEAGHRFPDGSWRTHAWAGYAEFRLPLRWIASSEAAQINWWWERGLNLAFTFDSSDDTSVTLCRIVNDRQPVGSKERPYADLWRGSLELAGITDGRLSF